MKVDLLDHMGDDLMVVNAARVSFDKRSFWVAETDDIFGPCHLEKQDVRLLGYLAKHGHWSPFAHPQVSFRVKAPVFVARQLGKHQVGLAWNEVSRRYVDSAPEFYAPKAWRVLAKDKKQGSGTAKIDWIENDCWEGDPEEDYVNVVSLAEDFYRCLIDSKVCPEQARMVLPQSMYTEWIWTGSLYAFARVWNERKGADVQAETRAVAQMIEGHMSNLFPRSWEALTSDA